jgi:hypothetical protein
VKLKTKIFYDSKYNSYLIRRGNMRPSASSFTSNPEVTRSVTSNVPHSIILPQMFNGTRASLTGVQLDLD